MTRSPIFRALASMAIAGALGLAGTAQAQRVQAMLDRPEADQREILRAAIVKTGGTCEEVTVHLYKGSDDFGAGHFAAACADGGEWLLMMEDDADATTQVMPCDLAAGLGIACWERY